MTESQLVAPTEDLGGVDQESVSTDAIIVHLGAGRFAVDLASVAEVGRAPAVTRVPGLPAWLAGVANWRGRILPILDLRPLLGAEAVPLESSGRLIVLTDGSVAVGLLVDAVDGTTALVDVAPFPPASAPIGSNLLSGQSPREDGPLAVLDVPAVMRLRESLPRGRRTA
ncbi:MAG: chemotaxis protein CheW [Frankiaceae bacterium]|nr:chemotaxis protein CheW [Frankiaceae bacterium]